MHPRKMMQSLKVKVKIPRALMLMWMRNFTSIGVLRRMRMTQMILMLQVLES